jgi:hypothetical protein
MLALEFQKSPIGLLKVEVVFKKGFVNLIK